MNDETREKLNQWHVWRTKMLDDMKTNVYSPRTIASYAIGYEKWNDYLLTVGGCYPQSCTQDIVDGYRRWLAASKLSRGTQIQYLVVIRRLIKYMRKHGCPVPVVDGDIDMPRRTRREDTVKYLLPEEVEEMIRLADTARDKAIILTLFTTGLRLAELRALDRAIFSGASGQEVLSVRLKGKGGKVRTVFFSKRTVRAVKEYLQHDSRSDTLMFPCSARWIYERVREIGNRALDKPVSPHTLRHSHATYLMSKGVDIRTIQALLGHSSIVTTQIYAGLTDDRLREVHESVVQ